jgi:hypothetical protein
MNLDETDKPLAEQLAVSIDFSNHIQNNQFSFNPVIIDRTTKNPFNLEERTYPVDMGARRMEIHSIQIELPDGYQIADGPKNVKLVLPENTAEYRYRTSYENNKLELHQSVHFNKAIYSVEEYFHLKEFYSRMIQQQKIDFLFRKSL